MQILGEVLLAAGKIAAPILLLTLLIGLVISVLQVVTQVQEMTLTFIPKLIGVGAICLLLGGWMITTAVELSKRLFELAGTF